MISPGTLAPDFTLPRDGGGSFTLSAQRPGKVVLYFYPKDATPACTAEAQDFSALSAEFAAASTLVVGLSRDSVAAHDRFCARNGLSVILVSDAAGAVCAAYGTWAEKQLYGRAYMGIVRTTFLIDGTGRVAQVWTVARVKDHAGAVLDAARNL